MHKLERLFAAPLLRRTAAGVFPTEAGAALVDRVRRAMGQLDAGLAEFARGKARRAQVAARLTTAQLEALIAVVRHGSFAVAARAVGRAAPTLHRAVRDLEAAIDGSLFETTSYGVKPTRAADALARRAGLFFHEIDQAAADIGARAGRVTGATAIGAMPLARGALLPKALAGFETRFAGHRVSLIEGPYDDLVAGLRRGEIDFLIGALREPAPSPDLIEERLFEDPLSILMRAGHPLAARRRLSVAALAAYPWVAPRVGTPLHANFCSLFEGGGVPAPTRVIECNSLSASRVLLLESDRLMLLSDAQTTMERAAGLLVSRRHPLGRVVRPIGLTFRRDWRPTELQKLMLGDIRDAVTELAG